MLLEKFLVFIPHRVENKAVLCTQAVSDTVQRSVFCSCVCVL